VWLGPEGLDAVSADRLQSLGVDEVVLRRGSVDLGGPLPVVRFEPAPPVEGSIPVAVALQVRRLRPEPEAQMGEALWRALNTELDGATPAELILDLPVLVPGLGAVVNRLAQASGVDVVPVLTTDQLTRAEGRELVSAARGVMVLAFGTIPTFRPGSELRALPLDEQLAPIAQLGHRVRLGVVLTPRVEPALGGWVDRLKPLCDRQNAEVSTASALDRSFKFLRTLKWAGRHWQPGQQVSARWMDAARLDAALSKMARLHLPELGGWDLISLPPDGAALGFEREALIAYLDGRGPAPEISVELRRRGRELRVRVLNSGPFQSAVSAYGNWVEVSVPRGALVTEERGSFDRIQLGSRRSGDWQRSASSGVDAVRFFTTFVGPHDTLETGVIRLPTSRSRVTIRWQTVLSEGPELRGLEVSIER